jgi:hypothetical protein
MTDGVVNRRTTRLARGRRVPAEICTKETSKEESESSLSAASSSYMETITYTSPPNEAGFIQPYDLRTYPLSPNDSKATRTREREKEVGKEKWR